ncbi:hypothetical protein [Oerskovia flava]|uniref:hypothetical protein n=1 Tax=Oerskovia flava TaxID=2986422 RepID=UPI00223F39F8|nr:hypothetical protein [Oerskovia sp. JB1-3-2]
MALTTSAGATTLPPRRPAAHAARRTTTALVAAFALVVAGLGSALPAAADDDPPAETLTVLAPDDLAITGELRVGKTVMATSSAWDPVDAELSYAWFADDTEIDGETAPELTLAPTHVGATIAVEVTGTAPEHTSATTRATSEEPVAPAPFTSAPTPSISGTVRVGNAVSAKAGTWSPDATLSYQWKLDGTPLSGATTSTYTPTAAAHGKKLTVTVTGKRTGYSTVSTTSTATTVAAGKFSGTPAPTVSGTVRVGNKVTAKPGTWSPSATLTYQWKLDGKALSGATTSTYTPTAATHGKKLTVTVTGKRTGYSTVSTTSTATTVAAGTFTVVPTPKISGTAHVGKTLKASPGTWSPAAKASYQWKANGKAIKGATSSTYTLRVTDHAKTITVTVKGTRTAYASTSVTSKATAKIAKPFTKTVAPRISGTARVGSTLKATTGAWSPNATISYQWKRNGTNITGATKSSYRVAAADYGKTITVVATGKRAAYITKSHTSAKTATVAKPSPAITKSGTYAVGSGIAPGTYVSSGGDFCYWERRSSAGSSFSGIIANDIGDGQRIVTIKSTDRYFMTDDCGSWTRLVALGSPRTTMPGDGIQAVGIHIRPGLYTTAGSSDGCYWAVLSGFSGSFNDILENDFAYGRQYVEIFSSDVGFESSGCGTWTRVG